jgi:uncharacterized protein (TIGR03083 family)
VSGAFPHARYCDLLAAEVEHLARAVHGADPATAVRTCGRWRLRNLIHHIGHVHRWVGPMVRDYSRTRQRRTLADDPLPADPAGYPDWLREADPLLVDVLRKAEPDRAMWAWGADKHVRFWSRRMLHETGVHRADAELALGRDPAYEPEVAADGIDEFLEILPATRRWGGPVRHLRGTGERILLRPGDLPGHWVVRLTPDGFDATRAGSVRVPKADATIAGTVTDLYLWLWGRRGHQEPGRFTVTGDGGLLDRWRTHSSV